jgi:uncharacterized protein YjbI with pentapeptide repeats
MANNCTATTYVDGGTWIDTTLVNPTATGARLNNTSLTGGVTLDNATAVSVAQQICDSLKSCIQSAVDNGVFTGVTLHTATLQAASLINAQLSGAIALDAAASSTLAAALCEDLGPCITSTVQTAALSALDATNANLTNASLLGTLTLSQESAQAIFTSITAAIDTHVADLIAAALLALTPEAIGAVADRDGTARNLAITGGTLQGVDLSGGTVDSVRGGNNEFTNTRLTGSTTILGQVPLDTAALSHLCSQLQPCIDTAVQSVANAPAIAGVFQDCTGSPRAPFVRIPSCEDMNSAISLAVANLPAVDLISSFEYDEDNHVLVLTTRMDDGTEQQFTVYLDSLGGQVVTDNVTIGGNGTTGSALYLIITETTTVRPVTTGPDLPTNIHGSRSALLGQPDKFLEIGGYIIPAYNKP